MIRFAVLFDMDGTIFKTETIVESAFEATFETLRTEGKWVGETPLDRYRSILGVTLEQVWIEVMPNASDDVRRDADQLLLAYMIEELKNGHGELYEMVKETLAELSEMGIPLFIASNGLEPYIDAIASAEGLHSVFEDLYSAGRFGTKSKTELVSKLLNDYEIQSGVFVGDRKGDIVAGSQNGLTTIGCQFGFAHSNELEGADYIVTEFFKVGEIIKRAYEAVMITEIYLVRHAHSEYSSGNEETRGLSGRGRNDALIVTKLLSQENVQVVCSSPYARAIQTVEGIASILGVPTDLDERFRERDFAEHGYAVGDRLEAMERGFMEPDFAFPGGESNREVELRGICAMNQVVQKYSGKRVAIGIHGGIMTLIMHHYDPRFDAKFLRHLPKPDIYKLIFENDKFVGIQKIGTFGDKSIAKLLEHTGVNAQE